MKEMHFNANYLDFKKKVCPLQYIRNESGSNTHFLYFSIDLIIQIKFYFIFCSTYTFIYMYSYIQLA